MRFLRRSLIGVFLISMTLGLLTWAGVLVRDAVQERMSGDQPRRPARERVFAIETVTVEPATISPVLTSFGEVRSRRTLELRTAASGRVVEIAAELVDGGRVEAGALLLRIDPTEAQSALDLARADLREVEAEQRDAERGLELARDEVAAAEEQVQIRVRALTRQKDLLARGVGTEAAVETAELAASSARQAVLSRRQALAQAEARIDQALTALERRQLALAEAERRLADTEIRADFAGALSDVSVVEGGLVSSNERLAELVDPAALEVAFRVSTPQYARLLDDTGRLIRAEVKIVMDILGVDLSATGRITRESAAVGEGQTGRLIFAEIGAAPGFRPGDFVSVRIEEPPLSGVALLPAAAVDAAGTVLVIGAEDRLESLPVEVLRRQGDDVIIRAGRVAGRKVVAERSPLLGAGIRVKSIQNDGAAAPAPEPEMLELDDERRAKLVAFVEGNQYMPKDVKERILSQLAQPMVPAQMVERIESRMGG
ncbi:MAG: HlyD family efflux transporter periplasmic adaptor subunit [Rhodobacteraceae bacterium]|nr:HlyD family efflux transporter periplasmic adaptor subunit [Paracoccaceae bacterium]